MLSVAAAMKNGRNEKMHIDNARMLKLGLAAAILLAETAFAENIGIGFDRFCGESKDMERFFTRSVDDLCGTVIPIQPVIPIQITEEQDFEKYLIGAAEDPWAILYGWTPLHYAAFHGHEAEAEWLIGEGSSLDAPDGSGRTPLHLAGAYGLATAYGGDGRHEAIAMLLIDAGADVHAKDDNGWTPLHSAATGEHEPIAELLIEHGADVDAKDNDGKTPLHYAALRTYKAVAKFLLERGADVDAKDNDGETPLHHAALAGAEVVAGPLIAAGADLDAQNVEGQTPLHLALSRLWIWDTKAVAEMLIEHGAKLDTPDIYGRTALYYALMLLLDTMPLPPRP